MSSLVSNSWLTSSSTLTRTSCSILTLRLITIGSLGASICTLCWQAASASRAPSSKPAGRSLAAKALHPLADPLGNLVAGHPLAQDIGELALEVEVELDRMAVIEVRVGAGEVQCGVHRRIGAALQRDLERLIVKVLQRLQQKIDPLATGLQRGRRRPGGIAQHPGPTRGELAAGDDRGPFRDAQRQHAIQAALAAQAVHAGQGQQLAEVEPFRPQGDIK